MYHKTVLFFLPISCFRLLLWHTIFSSYLLWRHFDTQGTSIQGGLNWRSDKEYPVLTTKVNGMGDVYEQLTYLQFSHTLCTWVYTEKNTPSSTQSILVIIEND